MISPYMEAELDRQAYRFIRALPRGNPKEADAAGERDTVLNQIAETMASASAAQLELARNQVAIHVLQVA